VAAAVDGCRPEQLRRCGGDLLAGILVAMHIIPNKRRQRATKSIGAARMLVFKLQHCRSIVGRDATDDERHCVTTARQYCQIKKW
jgi:hypothetical protein